MKYFLQLFVWTICLPFIAAAQNDYKLDVPTGWKTEKFSFPIEFAPQIPYKGTEDVRFAPGWDDPASEEHWTYAFLWWLQGNPQIDADALEQHLKSYYSGLVGRNITSRQIPSKKVVSTSVHMKKVKTAPDDINTFGGTIRMLDYHAQRPITLNCQVHVRRCKKQRRTAVYFEVSPRPHSHAVWQTLNGILTSFTCGE